MTIANYRIVDRVCATAGSSLYRARRLEDGTQVLFKRLDVEHADVAQSLRFRRECQLLARLDVEGLVKPLEAIDDRGCPALVLEDFAGQPLDAVAAGTARMDWLDCLRIASRLARTLAGLHAAQLIHRDIRPANILVAPGNGELRLADLSLATACASGHSGQMDDGAAPGDWAYVSPEQTGRMNRPVDCRSDFYSLGITLYRMLTGRLPFQGSDPLEWAHCHIACTAVPLAQLVPDIPAAVAAIVMKLLAKLPEERYQSASGLQADIAHCLAQWRTAGRIDPFEPGADDVSERFEIARKLYGRDQERAALLDAFGRAAARGEAALVTVSGYSGIGKSALVRELHMPIVQARGHFITGKFDQFMRDIPYATLTQAFRELVQQLLSESEAGVAAWRERIRAALGAHGQLIVDLIPQVELIIGRQAPVPALPAAEAQNRFRLVFQRFLAVFTRQRRPLTLFLDDMQWADSASLQFLEHLLAHPEAGPLVLIAAYRDNEVDPAHPLTSALEGIRSRGIPVHDIRLAPLALADLNRLVSDTLHARPENCEALTRVIFERTEGNPFFFTQFLRALADEGVLRHDPQGRTWRWDLARIRSRGFADNVADLMAGKLRRLPETTQAALQLAACLGSEFELRHLALISGLSCERAWQRLSAAVREDLIVRTGGRGKFLHDRIQQAAYALLAPGRRAGVHLRIGRTLLARMEADEIDAHLFDLATQLNQGAALLSTPGERVRAARINLRAARKAKASVAYGSACAYLAAGMALFEQSDWDSRHGLMFKLWLERADCEFLSGGLELAAQLIAILFKRAGSKSERVAVYDQQTRLHVMKSECPQGVESALACLRLLGIDMPAHPTREQVAAEFEQVWLSLGGRAIEDIAALPPLADPQIRTSMDTLATAIAPACFTDMQLFYLVVCRLTKLSLLHGTNSASAYAYGLFGFLIGPVFHRYADGYRFGKLACELAERHDFSAAKAQIYLVAGHISMWTQPLASTIDFLRATFHVGAETGDLFTACHNWLMLIGVHLLQGTALDQVWRETEQGLAFVEKLKYQDDVNVIISQQRFIATMRGRSASLSTFSDAGPDAGGFDEAAFEAYLRARETAQPICRHLIFKVQARFLSGDHAAALAALWELRELAWATLDQPLLVLDYHYYAALTLAACYERACAEERRAWQPLLTAHLEQLGEWADNNPSTFADKHALVAAEIARIEGRGADAMRLYEQAVEAARAHGFVHHEGIAHEAAVRFYLAQGAATAARAHLARARHCFASWGAEGKVRQLDEQYPGLFEQLAAGAGPAAPAAAPVQLDALSVAKASQAISGSIVIDELIDTLMRIVLENAGAQAGTLLLVRGGELVVAAEAGVAQQGPKVRLHTDQAPPGASLPETIVNYVRRSRTVVLLADVTEAHAFSSDPYLAGRRPKSVLCMPIVRQATLIGLLYLENTLIPHAFTAERVMVLELLASQAAISLENAQLYSDLRQENAERKRVEAVLREREGRIRRLVESNIIGIFFWDMHGSISDANEAFLDLIGYGRQELLSGQMHWAHMTPPEYAGADARALDEIRQAGTCATYEKQFVRKDGARIPVLIGGALLEGSQENGVAFVLDLSASKQAEAERTARQAAEQANRAKSTFLANMSHELRTPLNGILGYAQILQRDRAYDEKQVAALAVIRQSGEHLLSLINDILDLAKIEANKLQLYNMPVRLAEFVDLVSEMIAVKAAQKGLEMVTDVATGLPAWIKTDAKRLRQVLFNLLSNAVKFTERGRVVLAVRFLPPSSIRFEVRDSGVGIAQGELANIFEPFEQVGDTQGRLGGTGLGLAITRHILRLMGSEVHVDSRPGQGSSFWFELDVAVVEPGAAPPPAPTVSGYSGPRKSVLVVDDLAENRAVLRDMLGPLGFTIAEAADGATGVDMARALRPDLILMDVIMPTMDGLEAMRRLRRLPGLHDVPIIAVSASASGGDASNSRAAGASAFLPKPLNLELLLGLVGELLKIEWIGAAPLESYIAREDKAIGPLETPPREEMEILHRLARRGNMQDILARANYLIALDERYRPFAEQLSMLAKGYRSKAVHALVAQYMGGQQPQ